MFIAKKLRKENIIEYVLYMWQVEDLLRACDCSLSRLSRDYLARFQCSDDEREELTDWYADLISMMNREGRRETGHLQINALVVGDLAELHARLLASADFPFYTAQYYKVLPFIVELRQRLPQAEREAQSEVETCLGALYGTLMLRLRKRPVTPATATAVKEMSTMLSLLADYYRKDKAGELEQHD